MADYPLPEAQRAVDESAEAWEIYYEQNILLLRDDSRMAAIRKMVQKKLRTYSGFDQIMVFTYLEFLPQVHRLKPLTNSLQCNSELALIHKGFPTERADKIKMCYQYFDTRIGRRYDLVPFGWGDDLFHAPATLKREQIDHLWALWTQESGANFGFRTVNDNEARIDLEV